MIFEKHIESILTGEWDKDRLRRAYALFQMRQGRGSGILNDFRIEKYIMVGGALKILFPAIDKITLILVAVLFMLATYFIGYYDEKVLKLWQTEAEMQTSHINPYYQRLENKMDKVLEALDGHH